MEDLQLQVAMYNIVFQVYADKVDRHKSMTGYTMCRACFLFVVFLLFCGCSLLLFWYIHMYSVRVTGKRV